MIRTKVDLDVDEEALLALLSPHAREVLEREARAARAGEVNGRSFTEWVPDVKELKRAGRWREAESLLIQLCRAAEAWGLESGYGTPPWYGDQLRIVRKKGKL